MRRHFRPTGALGLAVLALAMAACNGAPAGGPSSTTKKPTSTTGIPSTSGPTTSTLVPTTTHPPTTTAARPTTTTALPQTTTTRPPPPTTVPLAHSGAYGVGLTTIGWTNPYETATNYATGGTMPRTLITEIRYPTAAATAGSGPVRDAPPDYRQGPFPVVVFAHGYDTLPDPYDPLLDAWVSAGFVVVAPLFPDENEYQVNSYGGPDSYAGSEAQADKSKEPYDISYVIAALDAETPGAPASVKRSVREPANASFLRGLVDPSRLALAGQSDGGEVVANLAFDSHYASTWEGLAIHPAALGVFSGQLWQPPVDSYGASGSAPPVLVAQSAADACNPPQYSTTIYNGIGGDRKWFLEFFHSTHIAPYWGLDEAAAVAEAVTSDFFEIALGWHAPSMTTIRARGDVAGVTSLSDGSQAPYIPPLSQNPGAC